MGVVNESDLHALIKNKQKKKGIQVTVFLFIGEKHGTDF